MTLTPTEVLDTWAPALGDDCPLLAKRFLRDTLPPINREAVEICLQQYEKTLGPGQEEAFQAASFYLFGAFERLDSDSSSYGTSHPVAFGLKMRFGNPFLPEQELIRVFITLCRDALDDPAPNFDAGIYYQQVLSLRDVLLDLKKHEFCHHELKRQPIDSALRYSIFPHRHYWFDPSTTTENFKGKLDRVEQLLCGSRRWGQRLNSRGGSNAEGATRTHFKRPEEEYDGSLWLAYIQSLDPPAQTLADLADDFDDESETESPLDQHPEGPVVPISPDATAEQQTQKRRQFSNHLAAANVPSDSDFGRASVAQVGEWLAVVAEEDRTTTILCWLLWSTGMPLKRILLTRVDSNLPTGMSPVWNPANAQLSYVVEHYEPAGQPEPQVMRLQCPVAWIEALPSEADERVFTGCIQKYDAVRSQSPAARLPALKTWPKSSGSFHAFELDSVERALVKGQLKPYRTAPAVYRSIDLVAVNAKVRRLWLSHTQSLAMQGHVGWLDQIGQPAPMRDAVSIGSVRNADLSEWAELGAFLRARKTASIRSAGNSRGKRLACLVELTNLQAINAYLAYAMVTVGRELKDTTEMHLTADALWLADKTNGQYQERKWFQFEPNDPSVNGYLKQITAIDESVSAIQAIAKNQGVQVLTVERQSTFPRYVCPAGSGFEVRRLTAQAFRRLAQDLGLPANALDVLNRIRHHFATMAPKEMHESIRSEILGHKFPGEDIFGLESAATAEPVVLPSAMLSKWFAQTDWRVLTAPVGRYV